MVISPLIDLASDVFFLIGGLFALICFIRISIKLEKIGEILNDIRFQIYISGRRKLK